MIAKRSFQVYLYRELNKAKKSEQNDNKNQQQGNINEEESIFEPLQDGKYALKSSIYFHFYVSHNLCMCFFNTRFSYSILFLFFP